MKNGALLVVTMTALSMTLFSAFLVEDSTKGG